MSENVKTIEIQGRKTASVLEPPESRQAGIETGTAGTADNGGKNISPARNAGAMNAIISGSRVTGNMIITQDLEVTGDYEGDITSNENSNIFIKGNCNGNIRTKGGSVEIEGGMNGGDIVAGGYVKVTGKFHGGKIQAATKIHINGEFSGTLESAGIEVGANATGHGELVYREYLSIEKGAKFEGRIVLIKQERAKEEHKEEPKPKKGFFSKKTR